MKKEKELLKDLVVRIGPFDIDINFVPLNGEIFGNYIT